MRNIFSQRSAFLGLLTATLLGLVLCSSRVSGTQQSVLSPEQASAIQIASNNASKITPVPRIEISPGNYWHNLEVIKKIVGPDVKICVVMKSDAYGHGIENIITEAVASNPAYIAAIYNAEFRIIYKEIKKQKKDIALLRIAPVLPDELAESIKNK